MWINSNPSDADIEDKVVEIISKQMGVGKETITRGTHLINDLNADSLDTVKLAMEFETELHIHLPDEEAQKLHTVDEVISYAKERGPIIIHD